MRLTRVHAVAFGALRDKILELGPGLNVIVGPNESGKSTWHAAIYAALCGLPPRTAWTAGDQRFAAYRKPRASHAWAVGAELDLLDGVEVRHIELEQHLLDPDASCAVDLDTGEDITREIRSDGGPDAARWVGFDRRSYAATSWIEQAGARSALVSTDGRNALQLAVAACVGEDEVDTALAQIEATLRGHVGDGQSGVGARAAALARVDRLKADRAYVERLRVRRDESATALANARAAAEIARKKVLAAQAFEARDEATRLRKEADVPVVDEPTSRADEPTSRNAAAPTADAPQDTEMHYTVIIAELNLREVDRDIALHAEATSEAGKDAKAGKGAEDAEADEPAEAEKSEASQRRWARLPTLDRLPGLDQIWGIDRVPGFAWVRQQSRQTLLAIAAGAALLIVAGIVSAIVFQSIIAIIVVLLAAFALLVVLLHLTPTPVEKPVEDRTAADFRLRREVALTKLSAALIARGRRARPSTAEADFEQYRLDCEAAAERSAERTAEAERANDESRARREELYQAQVAKAVEAEQRALELEQAADPYDLNLPYRPSVAEAHGAYDAARVSLAAATQAMATLDSEIAAHPPLPAIDDAIEAAQERVARVDRLDRVLQRARSELTLAREAVLRDIASGLVPRLTDYLAEFTDRPYAPAEVDDLRDQIGESLLNRDPELGSFSTSESTYLFTRVALGQHLAGDAPQGPLLIDDITSSADSDRIRRMMGILRRIAAQRQVVVFAHQSQVRKWAQRHMGPDPGIRLIRLTSVDEQPTVETVRKPSAKPATAAAVPATRESADVPTLG